MTAPQTHEITVAIAPKSLATLIDLGASLYALPAFQTSNHTGRPLVVQAISPLSPTVAIRWTEIYQGFVSRTALSDGLTNPVKRTIVAGSTSPARLGQVLTVSETLEFVPTNNGTDGAITMRTDQPGPLSCGIAYGDEFRLSCALTLAPGIEAVIVPVQSLFLMFSTSQFEVGAWVEQSSGEGLLVTMANVAARTVTFDQSATPPWREASNAWAQLVAAGESLPNLLRRIPPSNTPRK